MWLALKRLTKLEPFNTLRFMDWGNTNNSLLKHWQDRPQLEDYTYTIKGVPYEWMVEICNLKRADCWVCVPHEADDIYIREMARLFRDQLDPSLKIFVEYSNEIWNWMFDQTHYLFNNGDQNVEWPERIVPFIQNVMDIWTGEFAGQMDRLVRVVGVQAAWQDVSNRVVFNMRPGSFDAFSPAAYFGFSDNGYTALEKLGSAAMAEDVLFLARQAMLNDSYQWIKLQYETIALPLNIPMIYYEGGQHLTPNPFGTIQPYYQALMDAQTHPAMYDLYQEWFDSLRTFIPDGQTALLMNFSFISNKDGQYGSWGVLENQFDQHPPYRISAPKYQAILDNLCDLTVNTESESPIPKICIMNPNYPNPFNGSTRISFYMNQPDHVELMVVDLNGRKIRTLIDDYLQQGLHSLQWDASDNSTGVFLLRMRINEKIFTRKCVLIK